jgi:hypothetical protein
MRSPCFQGVTSDKISYRRGQDAKTAHLYHFTQIRHSHQYSSQKSLFDESWQFFS